MRELKKQRFSLLLIGYEHFLKNTHEHKLWYKFLQLLNYTWGIYLFGLWIYFYY